MKTLTPVDESGAITTVPYDPFPFRLYPSEVKSAKRLVVLRRAIRRRLEVEGKLGLVDYVTRMDLYALKELAQLLG